jgi:sulfonate transport system substrate-binding protein
MMAAAMMCVLCACALVSAVAQDASLKVAVNTTTIESFPVFAAAANAGPSAVQLVPSPNGRNAMAQLVSGAVDTATGSETQALLNSIAEPRLRIVITLAECRYRMVARRSAGIRRLSDLRGKTIGVTMNTSSQYFLTGMLRKAKLTDSDVHMAGLEGQEMPAALKSGKVDAIAIWEPHSQNSIATLGPDAVVLDEPSVYTEQFNLNTRTDVLMNPVKRDALIRFIREITQASARIRTGKPDIVASLAPNVGLPKETIMAVWPQFSFPASISSRLRSALNDVETWVAAMDKRQPRPSSDLNVLIDTSLIEAARNARQP